MSVSARGSPCARRPFVTTPHHVSEDGVTAEVPTRGPCWSDGSPCRISVHHARDRTTGPTWGWVAVVRCRSHRKAFTVYPPGHVPYGRVPLVVLAPDGEAVHGSGDDATETFFAAAADAAKSEPVFWPVHSAPTPPDAVRSTQRRHVRGAAALLGLAGDAPGPDVAAAVTHLPCGALVEARQELAESRGLPVWARVVVGLLREFAKRAGRALMDRLAVLGHLAGWWGRPFRWAPRSGRLLELGRPFWVGDDLGTRSRSPP